MNITKTRLENLSDAVIAIATTLLVLEFTASENSGTSAQVTERLLAMWPHFVAFVLSFLLICAYWFVHHVMFHYLRVTDQIFIWLNLFFLMFVTFLPFPTDLLADNFHHEHVVVIAGYAACHLLTGSLLIAMWAYATHGKRLVQPTLNRLTIRRVYYLALLGPVVDLLALATTAVDAHVSLILLLTTPLWYFALISVDRLTIGKPRFGLTRDPLIES